MERPMLFCDAMVKAIAEGRKSVTRRPVYPVGCLYGDRLVGVDVPLPVSRIAAGDVLWVREAWCPGTLAVEERRRENVCYRAWRCPCGRPHDGVKWKPSIHMPRWACRIRLRVVSVHAERLCRMDDADAVAEGFRDTRHLEEHVPGDVVGEFALTWDALYARRLQEFERNPLVWVVRFGLAELET